MRSGWAVKIFGFAGLSRRSRRGQEIVPLLLKKSRDILAEIHSKTLEVDMKKLTALIAALILAGTGLVFAVDPAEGFWISIDEKSQKPTAGWRIWEEGGKLSGKVLSIADLPQDTIAEGGKGKRYDNFMDGADVGTLPSVGTTWIWGLSNDGEGKWSNGYIIDPNDGKRYKCRITFHKADGKKYKVDTLEMRGEIGPFGRSQFWQTSTESEASSLR